MTRCHNSATLAASVPLVLQVQPVLKSTNAIPHPVLTGGPAWTFSTTTRATVPWDSKGEIVGVRTAASQALAKMEPPVLTLTLVLAASVSMVSQGSCVTLT